MHNIRLHIDKRIAFNHRSARFALDRNPDLLHFSSRILNPIISNLHTIRRTSDLNSIPILGKTIVADYTRKNLISVRPSKLG